MYSTRVELGEINQMTVVGFYQLWYLEYQRRTNPGSSYKRIPNTHAKLHTRRTSQVLISKLHTLRTESPRSGSTSHR